MDPRVAIITQVSGHVVEALAASREELDALNVFPVADGDTGTNLFLTFDGAHSELVARVDAHPDVSPLDAVNSYDRSLLVNARGNSGVIMAQMFGTFVRRMVVSETSSLPVALADAMLAASEAAYAAVGKPVEGTVLTVARAASQAAQIAGRRGDATIARVLRAASSAARDALDQTPELLPVLRKAGVVDAGGSGLCVVLDAVETALTGTRRVSVTPPRRRVTPVEQVPELDLTEGGPAYEVMYLLDLDPEAGADAISKLREELMPLGDSLVVVGSDRVWNVHVHVDDVGAAIEAGIRAGTPYRVRVTHFAEQATGDHKRQGRRIVAVAFGDGLAEVFQQAGASVVMAYPDVRPSAAELTDAILATGAAEVFLMPNDRRLATADTAAVRAAERGVRVAVVPTQSQVQGLAALAVHERTRSFEQDLVEMAAAGRHARSGAVTIASVEAMTMAGPCKPGDALGVIEGDFAVVGTDLFEVATGVLDRLIGGGGELVTIVTGADSGDLGERCEAYVAATYAHVDVLTCDGRQERYPLFFGVE